MSSLVKLEKVSKVYQIGEQRFTALDDVDFELNAGEMTAIVGASGSGKSTMMNIIGFLDHCTTGRYYFSKQDVSHLADYELAAIRNKKIGFIFSIFFLISTFQRLAKCTLAIILSWHTPS